jgi:hypothetical protein
MTLPAASSPAVDPAQLPDHLVPLDGDQWAFWKPVALRGAGFPADLVLRLTEPQCAAATSAVLEQETALNAILEEQKTAVDTALDALREAGQWDDKERRKPLMKALKALNQGKVPKPIPGVLEAEAIARVETALAALTAAQATFQESYAAALDRQSQELTAVASLPTFQEAVLWQNLNGYRTAVRKVAERAPKPGQRNSQRRQHEELVASYLQRYAVKNDTIGFFGPICWGHFDAATEVLAVNPGDTLLARREVFLEAWGLERVAEVLLRDPRVRWSLRPRMEDLMRLEGDVLYAGTYSNRLPPAQAMVLRACDGRSTARQVAASVRTQAGGPDSEEAVFKILQEMADTGFLTWDFEVPIDPFALGELRGQVDRIEDAAARQLCHRILNKYDGTRQAVADAAGDPAKLERALGAMEKLFTTLTRQASTRRAGLTYGGRTLAYEDCLRNLDFTVGEALRRDLSGPLALILQSARWLSQRAAGLIREEMHAIYDRLVAETGSPEVESYVFWQVAEPLLQDDRSPAWEQAVQELNERWQQILQVEEGATEPSHFTSAELADQVAELFPADGPGWRSACHHNPDVMIVADGMEALQRGEYQLVLGEVHAGRCVLNSWAFLAMHPDRQEIYDALDADMPEQRVVPLRSRNSPNLTTRCRIAYYSPKDLMLKSLNAADVLPEEQLLETKDVYIVNTEQGLRGRTRDGRVDMDLIEGFSEMLSNGAVSKFGLLPSLRQTPRITLDRLVVNRQSWAFQVQELEFATLNDPAQRYLEARRWQRRWGLPRFVFYKAAIEPKPCYLDFDSPIYIDLLAKIVRSALEAPDDVHKIKFSEMLPAPDQLWLPDAEGRLYTSELRIMAVDRAHHLK